MDRQQIKVCIRTRPTPDFASKNINIDSGNAVSYARTDTVDDYDDGAQG